jgi:hypothetical protein
LGFIIYRSLGVYTLMKTYDRIPPICDLVDSELQDRDYAIMELWHSLESYVKAAEQTTPNPDEYARIVNHPILYKYEDFVNATKAIYGHIKI